MEGGSRQTKLLSRLLGKLRGGHRNAIEKHLSFSSGISESEGGSSNFGCGSTTTDDDDLDMPTKPAADSSSLAIDDNHFAANIDLRYSGQYLTPEQLPEFCDQLHQLVEVIRNIQSYAKITGEYPSELERRLEREACEVAALAGEARNARDVVARARAQRRAVRNHRKHLVAHLSSLKETEVRELESTVRLSDRKLFKNWEVLKDSTDATVFEPLLEEIRNKRTALECLVRLIDSRRSVLDRAAVPLPQPLPPPMPRQNIEESTTRDTVGGKKRLEQGGKRSSCKRRRKETAKEPRSVPLSGEPSRHGPTPQVTLYIQGNESTSRYRVGSAGAVAITPLELPSGGSVRDILFFTTN